MSTQDPPSCICNPICNPICTFGAVGKVTKHLGEFAVNSTGKVFQVATSKTSQMEVQYLLMRITKKKILSVLV